MTVRFRNIMVLIALLALALVACAPDDLDVTPSPTATNTPEPTATPNPDATEAPEGADAGGDAEAAPVSSNQALVEQLMAAIPDQIGAGATQFRRGRARDQQGEPLTEIDDVEGGVIGTVYLFETGGGTADITYGVFDTPEAALAFYEVVGGRVRTLENAEEIENLPTPNKFGQGLYGSDGIIVRDNIYIRVSVPRFSSNAGNPNPLVPLGRAAVRILDETLGSSQ